MKWDEKTFAKLVNLTEVALSSDGKLIAYVVKRANLKENKYENTLVIEDFKGDKRRYVEDATMPRFSPDGKRILYLRVDEEKKKSDLYLLELESMTSKKLVEAKNIKGVDWNKDSRRILILISKKMEDDDLYYDSSIPIWFNGEGFRDNEKFEIQIYDTEGEMVVDEFEDLYVYKVLWHGEEIIYAVAKRENPFKLYDIYSYRRKKRKIFENVSFVPIHSNGKRLLLLGKKKKKYVSEHDYLYVYDGKDVKKVSEDYGLENYAGKIDSNGIVYALTADAGSVFLEKYEKGRRIRIAGENSYVYSFDVSKDGKIAFLMMSDVEYGELYTYDGKVRKKTSYNAEILKRLKPKKHIHFTYKTFDGKTLDGWYIRPGGRKKKAPLVVFVHGGPKGMYGHYFHINAQLLANNGYYVLFTNPRGSGGYDEDFALQVLNRTGMEDFKDIMHGLDALLRIENGIDEERIGITGISYGGYMTNWAITQSDRFKVAVSENGISYWLTSYAFSDIGLWFDREIVGDEPLKNENYRKLSPLFYADRVKASVLLIHSLEDYRCTLDQTVMFYHVLKFMGKDAHIVIFKEGEHGHSIRGKPRHRMKRYRIFLEFFNRKLKEGKEFKIEEVLGKK